MIDNHVEDCLGYTEGSCACYCPQCYDKNSKECICPDCSCIKTQTRFLHAEKEQK